MTDKKQSLERIKDMPKLKAEIIAYLFDFVSKKSSDRWWQYKGEFAYEGKEYNLECECRMDNQMFTYRHLFIEYKQVVIDLTNPADYEKYFGKDGMQ